MAQQPDLSCPYCFCDVHGMNITELLGEESAVEQWRFLKIHEQHSKGGSV